MFNLIITIISIALVAVLAIATIYYGGSAFTQGSAKASASTLVSHAQQIAAAETLYANSNGGAITTDVTLASKLLTDHYLTSFPASPNAAAYAVGTDGEITAVMKTDADAVCVAVNASLGNAATTVLIAKPATQYGCYDADGDLALTANDRTFFYKG